jgi:hypothetical protein
MKNICLPLIKVVGLRIKKVSLPLVEQCHHYFIKYWYKRVYRAYIWTSFLNFNFKKVSGGGSNSDLLGIRAYFLIRTPLLD